MGVIEKIHFFFEGPPITSNSSLRVSSSLSGIYLFSSSVSSCGLIKSFTPGGKLDSRALIIQGSYKKTLVRP